MSENAVLVEGNRLAVGYQGEAILTGIDFRVRRADYLGIIGPNGAGKTTLLKTVLGLLAPIEGQLTIREGRDGSARFGYVPQRETFDALFPLTALQVAIMGRFPQIGVGRRVRKHDWQAVTAILGQMGVGHIAGKAFRDLSGGQKQRVLIARALAGDPDALILDEPTASMDIKGEREVMDMLEKLREEHGIAVVMVSHFLSNLRDRVDQVLVCDREGRGFWAGSADSVLHPDAVSRLFTGRGASKEKRE